MGELVVSRWQRYGRDRLYVKTLMGAAVGWIDLQTWRYELDDAARADEFHSAVARFTAENSIPIAGAKTAAEDVAAEAEQWLASVAAAPATDDFYVRIDWRDAAQNRAGERAARQEEALRAQAPFRTAIARFFDFKTDERAWRLGRQGEQLVANELAQLPAGWHCLHAVEVGSRGSDVDHVVIGPAGVFTINAKHHPQAKIWVGGNTVMVNGYRQPYVRNSRHEAGRATKLLSRAAGFRVDVRGVIAVVNARDLKIKEAPRDVHVVARTRLRKWLLSQPIVISDDAVAHIHRVARRSTTWTA